MAQIRVAAERFIEAPPARLYQYIADYGRHHAQWLPPAFSSYQVERGGVGAGTIIRFHLKAGQRERDYRMEVSEPTPGQTIVERDLDSSLATTWTVSPEGSGSRVRLETTWQGAGGIGGFFERTFAPRVLQGLYDEELDRLDRYAREQASV